MPAVCATSAITTEVTTYKAIKMYGAVPRVLWLSFGSVDWVILLCSKPRSLALQWWGCISTKLKLAKELGTVYTVNVRNHDPVKEIKLGGANVAVSLEQAYQSLCWGGRIVFVAVGIRGLWNFSPARPSVPRWVCVRSVDVANELRSLPRHLLNRRMKR
jgi:D-arabinose 1-dehydrogenase-like Zn-dependent alcohol dehydrogenase